MEALSQRTGCHFLVLLLNSSVMDSWETRVFPSTEVKDALLNLFKLTPEDLALRLQAYLTTGIMGKKFHEAKAKMYLLCVHRLATLTRRSSSDKGEAEYRAD